MGMEIRLTLRVQEEDDGSVWAEVEEFPGCFASGDDLDELLEAMNEALRLYVIDNPEAQKKLRALQRQRATEQSSKVIRFPSRAPHHEGRRNRLAVEDVHATLSYEGLIEA